MCAPICPTTSMLQMDSSGDTLMDHVGENAMRLNAPQRDGGAPPPNCNLCTKQIPAGSRKRYHEGALLCQKCWDKQRRAGGAQSRAKCKEEVAGEISLKQHATRSTTAAATPTATQVEDTNWDPPLEELAAWKPDPQLAAAIAAQEAEWSNRTPAQWARRHYLMHVAPRCERCNFPRTGKKGWDEKNQCHTDKDCNTNRWRVLDAFC